MRFFLSLFLYFSLFLSFSLNAGPLDLNNWKQDFVLDVKQIILPDYPDAFNPSIVRWKNQIIMSFRIRDPITLSTDAIGMVCLDDDFNPITEPTILQRVGEVSFSPSRAQDPRLVATDHGLFIVYSNLFPYEEPVSRMYFGKIKQNKDGSFSVSNPSPILNYENEIRERKEKNWVPFVHDNSLLLAYSLQPHRILSPKAEWNHGGDFANSVSNVQWKWGELRGGTPAVKTEHGYLAFFHSDIALASVQSNGQTMNHYFMGAYTFEPNHPFSITGISPHPIVARKFYEGPMYNTWKPLRVVFPCGLIVDENTIWVSYGRQDHEMWVVKLDKAKLLSNLKPVNNLNGHEHPTSGKSSRSSKK